MGVDCCLFVVFVVNAGYFAWVGCCLFVVFVVNERYFAWYFYGFFVFFVFLLGLICHVVMIILRLLFFFIVCGDRQYLHSEVRRQRQRCIRNSCLSIVRVSVRL